VKDSGKMGTALKTYLQSNRRNAFLRVSQQVLRGFQSFAQQELCRGYSHYFLKAPLQMIRADEQLGSDLLQRKRLMEMLCEKGSRFLGQFFFRGKPERFLRPTPFAWTEPGFFGIACCQKDSHVFGVGRFGPAGRLAEDPGGLQTVIELPVVRRVAIHNRSPHLLVHVHSPSFLFMCKYIRSPPVLERGWNGKARIKKM
jgi:hypothetical protein